MSITQANLEIVQELQKEQEKFFKEKSVYHTKWLLSDNEEEKKELKKKEELVFEKYTDVNGKIRNILLATSYKKEKGEA